MRYKVTKDQLERIVENFVMEASIESKKAPVKNMIPSQAAAAKKHVKNKMSGDMVDQSEGMPSVTPMKKKLSQASDAKKHMSKMKAKHTNKAKVVKEAEEMEGQPSKQEIMASLQKVIKKIDLNDFKQALEEKGIDSKEEAKKIATDAAKQAATDNMEDEDYMEGMEEGLGGFVKKYKAGIGVGLLMAALAGLGYVGESAEAIVKTMREDSVLASVLQNPLWVGSIVSAIAGVALTGSAMSDENKRKQEAAKLQIMNQLKRKGYTEEVKDDKGNVVSLKNPKTNKTYELS
jgi:hypothetical protein